MTILDIMIEIIGWAAALLILAAYGLLSANKLTANDRVYQWMNVFGALGFVINLVTGTLFFIGAPGQYIDSPVWWGKLAFLAVAMINIAVFETRQGRRLLMLADGADTPLGCKLAGAVSITSWFAVMYLGRMLPFIGKAF